MNPDSDRPTGHELLLALMGALAVLLELPVIAIAGHVDWWMLPVILVVSVFVFTRRDSGHALAGLALMAVMWLVSGAGESSPWSLAIALLMFTAHASLALRTTFPPNGDLDRDIVTRWLARSGIIAALTACVYLLVFALRNIQQADAEVVLAAALAMVGALILLLRAETLAVQGKMTRRPEGRAIKDRPNKVREYL